ncbi:MAG TPA: EthD family reductase [Gammaproteobacteria bacterium]|jgi:uncharacterized protein (TIGR02118 family)|nr:EthD family reductase [Gammaproteobacteria bacterium]
MHNDARACSSALVSRRRILECAAAVAASTAVPRAFADAAGGVTVGMRAFTAIFPGGAGIHFDHDYYRDQHLVAMQRLYGAALARVEARRPVVAASEPPSPYAAIVNFWIPETEAFAKASAAHGQAQVQDKAHFTNSEQKVQSEVVFGEAGKPASAVRAGERCLTVLYPADPADHFDYDYYRDQHMTSLIELFGHEAISRIEIRKGLSSPDGRNPARYACTANIYVADAQVFAAAASRNRERVVEDIARFTSVGPISVMTEVFGAFDA